MNFHYARYENVKKSVPPKFKNEASDHLKNIEYLAENLVGLIIQEWFWPRCVGGDQSRVDFLEWTK